MSARRFKHYRIADRVTARQQLLAYANTADVSLLLDNNSYASAYHSYELLLAVGVKDSFETNENAFDQLKRFSGSCQDWMFGHLSYDLKNETEKLVSDHPDHPGFPNMYFFIPEVVIQLEGDRLSIGSLNDDHELIFKNILGSHLPASPMHTVDIRSRISRGQYVSTVNTLRQHILRGDCYEINFCQEFFAEGVTIDPADTYKKLVTFSPNPFSAYYKLRDKHLMCASPERYLKKAGDHLISQPIKGTRPRNLSDTDGDKKNLEYLYHDPKERAENVMVVDLVRNDLSKVCEEGSVKVDELFGVYSFPQVFQMISTISGKLRKEIHFADAIRATFPMGSMTGAPKKRVMELIEQYESTKRGLFSGAVGYITPGGDFDFNVVIRSIFYNSSNRYLSYLVGSGITFYCDAEKEYEECLLKAKAIQKVLGVPDNNAEIGDKH